MVRRGRLARGFGTCAFYRGREFVLGLGGCLYFGALDGAFGTSWMH